MDELRLIPKPYVPASPKAVQFKVNIDQELVDMVQALAAKYGVTQTLVTEQALLRFLFHQE